MKFMFVAHINNLIPSFWDDSFNVSEVELLSFSPWFMCEMLQFEKGSNEPALRSTHLIGDVINLHHFAKINEIEKTYIVIPAHLNKSGSWSIRRLKSVSKAVCKIEEKTNVVYRFETEKGELLDYDFSGFLIDEPNLKFDSILKFN